MGAFSERYKILFQDIERRKRPGRRHGGSVWNGLSPRGMHGSVPMRGPTPLAVSKNRIPMYYGSHAGAKMNRSEKDSRNPKASCIETLFL